MGVFDVTILSQLRFQTTMMIKQPIMQARLPWLLLWLYWLEDWEAQTEMGQTSNPSTLPETTPAYEYN